MNLILSRFRDAASKFPKYFIISMSLSIFLAVINALIPWGLREFLQEISEQNDYNVIIIGIAFFCSNFFH